MEENNVDHKKFDKSASASELSNKEDKFETIKKTSRLAIVSLILGFISVFLGVATLFIPPISCFFTYSAYIYLSITTFLLGVSSIVVISLGRQRIKGYQYAIQAIGLAFLCVLSWGMVARFVNHKSSISEYRLKKLAIAIDAFCQSNKGHLPLAAEWCDSLLRYDDSISRSDFSEHLFLGSGKCHFAFNKNLSNLLLKEIPGNTVLIFEADGDWNLSGGPELLETRRPKYGHIKVLLADFSIRDYWFYEDGIRSEDSFAHKPARWKP